MLKTIYRESRKVSEGKITQRSNSNICQITTELIKTVSQKLKSEKSDPLLNAHVSDFLLVSNLIPIVKDKLADVTNSNNYRSIATSSLVMKIFNWVIILAFSKHLKFDDLQFGYQANVSMSMCTWTAVETLSHFLRNGSDVFTCLMAMSNAFDMVKHSVLFNKLLKQGLPFIIVRFI